MFELFFEKYKNEGFESVLTSTLKRTHQTVAPFLELDINWEQHAEIDEMNWGVHEGKKAEPWMIEEYKKLIKVLHCNSNYYEVFNAVSKSNWEDIFK